MIRPARPQDIAEVVRIHVESFPNFFLSFLGPAFLRLLYEEILSSPEGVLLVAEEGERDLVGFVAGVTRQSGFYSRLVEHRKWRFAIAALPAVLRRPLIAARLVRALKRPRDASNAAAEACLMSIAVNPAVSGRGTGAQLVISFSGEMRRRAIGRYCLTTDRGGNDRINAFYRTLGFQLARTFVTAEGRPMNEYVMSTEPEIR